MGTAQGRVSGEANPRDQEMVAGSRGDLGVTLTTIAPGGVAGVSTYRNIDLDETGVLVRTGPGLLYGVIICNAAAAIRYVKIYDHADAPTNGDTPLVTLKLAASAGWVQTPPWPITITNGIGLRATTGVADNDVGAPAGNDIIISLFYV